MTKPLGVAVIGAGMAGRAHAAAYRVASTLYSPTLPEIRLVSIGDVNPEFGALAAKRFGYERTDSSWQAIAAADDIDVVSVVIANSLHREVVEGLLAAGKHVLCEKPLSDSIEDAHAMAAAAERADSIARIGFTYRRSPGIAYIRQLIQDGTLGKLLHFSGRYWTDYACSPTAPMSWRFKGGPGSGALADVGSHMTYIAEFLGGEIQEVSGGTLSTVIHERPLPLGAVLGHDHAAVSDTFEPVENDDYAAFSLKFTQGAGAIEVSRVARGHANSLIFEVFCENGAARYDQRRPSEIELFLNDAPSAQNGYRQIILGPEHPYIAGGLAMDAPSVGFGQNEAFSYQARSFLEEVAGISEEDSLPRCASFEEGIHNMELLHAVAESAAADGAAVRISPTSTRKNGA
ncbi:Gfo/Idh/MocA family protein [Pseudoclavibacter sp. VKM Ac-2867]|uniref:Gfo/Idh/MocA family protein n=1 Tax=Pseudoclavibacter sp. VKM Ac-2867 TaxID=2783829 RepID=UPI00188D3D2E|nr:Gfo/Idh/MocA family oxidoreductase [Pseudoclavibacter sp. VKM Ac-2867]MBF4459678.1 Gfo/Idh/MocA family oxidoreductase [Pseudoclavibacter sp. VKM Ac-2867]